MSGLGRIQPPDFQHVEKYPLLALPPKARPTNVPVIVGSNWYAAFDRPVNVNGHWWVGVDRKGKTVKNLGSIRGGHCYVLQPVSGVHEDDQAHWWDWYNQVAEGCCVGEGCSRAMSLLNRKDYQPWWLYRRAQQLGGITPDQEGAYVRDGLKALSQYGHVVRNGTEPQYLGQAGDNALGGRAPDPAEGISAYRWATSVDDVCHTLGMPKADHVTFDQSWGRSYPFKTSMPATVLDRLLNEQGEVGIVTDR